MAEDVVIRYRAEVDQANKELKVLVEQNKKLGTSSEQTAKSIDKETKSVDNLEKELTDTSKKVKAVSDSTKKLGSEGQAAFSSLGSQIKSFGKAAAISLGAAFSIDAVIQFGKASVNAFLEAEENANRLKFAITQIGGESEVAFDRLIRQSSRLQEITIFSDDSIQQAQAALSAFGLTADQIEALIPKLADFATLTSQDIPSAAAQIGAALEGNGKEFKKYGIEVSAAASRTENLNAILGGLDKFAGSAQEATTTLTGSLKQAANQADDLQESLGAKLAPTLVKLRIEFLKTIDIILTSGDDIREAFKLKTIEDANAKTLDIVKSRAKTIEEIYKIPPNESYLKSLEKEIALQEKARDVASKGTLAKNIEEYFEADRALTVLNAELEQFNAKLAADKKTQAALDARLLSLAELRKKSNEDLIKLGEKEKEIGDEVAKTNIKNIELVIKAREKDAEELKKNLAYLAKLQIDNIEDLKQQRIAKFEQETKELTSTGQLRADTIIELEKKLVKDLNEIDKQRNVDPLFRAPENKPAIPDKLSVPVERASDTVFDPEDVEQSNKLILQSTSDLLFDISALYATFNQQRLNEIEEQKNAELSAIDIALKANEEALKKGRITQVDAANVEKALLAEKVAAIKKANDEERKIKRKQAILDKTAALFKIAINTAEAVSKYLGSPPLIALALAAGAAQAAIVAAQPIPYKKGTKSAKGGLSLVGEEGPELMMLPKQSKILDAKKTKTHSEAIDAMYDNRFESFVLNRYVNPALKKAKKEKQQNDNVTFAENISKSFILNNMGLTEKELEKVRRRGQSINNVDELARAISQYTKRDPYR